ncbi:translocator protein, LysE family [Acetobacteraceae bacterium AT-5844]|nr:translocator protein, LysE family [Acetobacteraceae bacterium AT-5844]
METSLSLLGFAVAASITPGPNNLIISTMAAAGGWRAPVPAMLGVSVGFMVLLMVAALGLAAPLAASPTLHMVLRWVGVLWLLRMAWMIGRAPPPEAASEVRGFGFLGAAAFQWVNPKAWMIALAAMSAFTYPGEEVLVSGLRIAAVFGLVSMPSLFVWALLGQSAGRMLRTPRQWRMFNVIMGLLLAASVLPLLR